MLKFLLTALVLAATTATAATAQEVHIAVGQAGRGYEARGQEISQRLSQRGYDVQVDNYEGSDAISLAVCGERATMGIAQIDAIYARAEENCALKVVGTYGNEFAFLLFPPDSKNNELSDLGEGDKILVDTIGSGTELFWRTIVGIETGDQGNKSNWSKATPVHDLTMLADTMAQSGDVDALLVVGVPNNEEVLALLEKGWELGELYDKDINDMQYRGKSLYETETVEIKVPGRWLALKNDAYVVPSFIVIKEGLSTSDRKLYGDIVAASQ
jgi:TRAP-type uncharacterized transport system substrate-binding protein